MKNLLFLLEFNKAMQTKTLLFPLLILLGLTPIDFSKAASPIDIVINEIAWMGTNASYNDEWTVNIKQHFLYL